MILGSAIGESCEHRVSALALDVWSLGCFMFFLISGSPPFSAKGTNLKQCLADVCALHWQWEETYKEGNEELLSPDVHPMLDISAYVGN